VKILALTSSYPRYDGDATAPFIEAITAHVAGLGHEVHLVLPDNREWKRTSSEGNVHFHPYRYSPSRSWTPWGYSQSLEAGIKLRRSLFALAPLVLLSARRTCVALARREQFDVLHAHWLVPNGVIAAHLSKRLRLPLVISLHGSDVSVPERSRWMQSLVRRAFERAAAVTAPSQDLLDRASRLGARRLELLPYGADIDALRADEQAADAVRRRLGLSPDDVVVLGVGRFVHWKGFDYLLDAIGEARMSQPRLRLVLAGDGDLRDSLVDRARALGLDDHVSFAGMVPRDEVPAFFAASDVVAVPSIHYQGYVDGLPNVALEAMAAAKPVVASRVGGLPAVVQSGDNGYLVEERDPAALASAILRLAEDRSLRESMGARGQDLVRESLNWNALARRLDGIYDRVAGDRSRD
jgi:phosphatidyl-myo-inositol dimannoside synthase